MVGDKRIELLLQPCKGRSLPLQQSPIKFKELGVVGFEPTKPLASDLQSEVTLQRYRTPF